MLTKESMDTTELIKQVHVARQAAEQNRTETQAALDQAKRIQSLATEQLAQAQQKAETLKRLADEEIDNSMRQVRQLAEEFAAQMQNAPKPWSLKANELVEKVSALAASMPLASRHAKFIETLHSGDTVYVIPFKREAIVHRIHRKRRTILLFIENKQLEIPFDDIAKSPSAGID
jgi:hypothetical protein